MEDKLILLKRQRFPYNGIFEYEIHRGEISQTKNLILTVSDEAFAQRLVDGYNSQK
jgi:hypothetical protein